MNHHRWRATTVSTTANGRRGFETLWDRRTTIDTGEQTIEVLSLPDLVTAKKTQRDKDWPMITRLLEAHWTQTPRPAPAATLDFWLRELRSPGFLIQLAREAPADCRRVAAQRPLLLTALSGDETAVARLLREEEEQEREADRQYWAPLRRHLEVLRREHREQR